MNLDDISILVPHYLTNIDPQLDDLKTYHVRTPYDTTRPNNQITSRSLKNFLQAFRNGRFDNLENSDMEIYEV